MEIRRFAASGHGLPPFPEGTENPEFGPDEAGLSAHIMGSSVPLWLTNLGIDRWGEAWASSGGLVMRFQAELFEGRPLVMRITEADDRFDVDVSDETGGPCVSARVLRHGPPADRTVVSGRTAALPVDATAELLDGLRLAPLRFEFDAGRDLMIVRDIADGATWSDHRWAHPAWLVSSANAVIKRSVDFDWPRVWVNAGTEIDLHGVVCDGETVEVEAAVESLFERGRHRFANVVFALSAAGRRVASVRYALIYGRA